MNASAVFFDGRTNARQPVAVQLGPDAVEISAPERRLLAAWRFADIALFAAPKGMLRIGEAAGGTRGKTAARLEIRDTAFAAELMGRAKPRDQRGVTDGRTRAKVVLCSMAAIVSVIACGVWGVPLAADHIAPRLPVAAEMYFGDKVDAEIRRLLVAGANGKPLECGAGPEKQAARDAFEKLVGKLESGAALKMPLRVSVVRSAQVNAITLPGGHIYLYEALLNQANSVDEVAGVLAHEIGHAAHRDVTKAFLRDGGSSVLFGMVIGDFTGGGLATFSANVVLKASNSREAEAAADDFGGRLISRIGGDPRALGTILKRISGKPGQTPHFLLTHPEGEKRADALDHIAPPAVAQPLLDAKEWAAFKTICS
jgi:Zn-dependent protease with chaperone function